jgi:hypothetical protein
LLFCRLFVNVSGSRHVYEEPAEKQAGLFGAVKQFLDRDRKSRNRKGEDLFVNVSGSRHAVARNDTGFNLIPYFIGSFGDKHPRSGLFGAVKQFLDRDRKSRNRKGEDLNKMRKEDVRARHAVARNDTGFNLIPYFIGSFGDKHPRSFPDHSII